MLQTVLSTGKNVPKGTFVKTKGAQTRFVSSYVVCKIRECDI